MTYSTQQSRSTAPPCARSPKLYQLAIVAAVVVLARVLQLSQRTFYWDDLFIPAQYSPLRITGQESIFQLHDGHLMPGSALVQVGMHRVAALNWWPVAATIVILTVLSFLAWIPTVRVLAPQNPQGQVLALSAISFSPFLMDAAGWWSASLNAYAWQLAAAGTIYALFSRRYFWATAPFFFGLFFTEKAFTILPLAAVLLLIHHARQRSERSARIPYAGLIPSAALGTAWLTLFIFQSVHSDRKTTAASGLLHGAPTAIKDAILPGSIGGPWMWSRWSPSKAVADPQIWLCILAALAVVVLLGLWLLHARRSHIPLNATLLALLGSVGYLLFIFVLLLQVRDGVNTSVLILRSLHYYADWWTATVLMVLLASNTPRSRRILPTLTVLFIASALISTTTWTLAWRDDPARDYLATLRTNMQNITEPLLSQPTPLEILSPLAHPYNSIESFTGKPAADSTTHPQVIDDHGNVVDGAVLPVARTEQGSEPGCGIRIHSGSSAMITIDNPLPFGEWTWEMNAVASNPDMKLTITTPNGLESASESQSRATTVDVDDELRREWVRVAGGGGTMKIDAHSTSPTDSVCIGAGAIGPLVMAQ